MFSGPKEAQVLDVSWQKEISDKVMGKKGDTQSTDRVWTISVGESDIRVWGRLLLQGWEFYRLMSGRSISAILGKGQGFPGVGPIPTFGSLVSLRAVMTPVGLSLSLLMCSSERVLRLTVCWKSTPPPSWT